MPTGKTVQKRMRQNVKKCLLNKSMKSAMKTQLKKFQKLIDNGNLDGAKKEFSLTVSTLDKMAQKGIIHENNINRKKSKIQQALNTLLADKK